MPQSLWLDCYPYDEWHHFGWFPNAADFAMNHPILIFDLVVNVVAAVLLVRLGRRLIRWRRRRVFAPG